MLWKCNCGKTFPISDYDAYAAHVRLCNQKPRYACSVCGEIFSKPYYRRIHEKYQHGIETGVHHAGAEKNVKNRTRRWKKYVEKT